MNITIEISPDEDETVCGELLMRSLNKDRKHRWGYTTRDLDPLWEEVPDHITPLPVLTLLKGCFAKSDGERGVTKIKNKFTHVYAYLFWDGDGTMVFNVNGNLLVNYDVKNSEWEWNPDWINDLPKGYYEMPNV